MIPAESFHHHDDLIICKQTDNHIEEKNVECELCEFVLPEFSFTSEETSIYSQQTGSLSIAINYISQKKKLRFIPIDRGPPVIS